MTHFPAVLRFGRSLWTPDPVGISLVSTDRSPLSAVPLDIRIQSFFIPSLSKPLKHSLNFSKSKSTCMNHMNTTINNSFSFNFYLWYLINIFKVKLLYNQALKQQYIFYRYYHFKSFIYILRALSGHQLWNRHISNGNR